MLCVALAALPAMLVAGRLADVFGARLVPIFLVFFGAAEWLPGLARSVPTLVLFLAVVGIGTGLLDIAINASSAASAQGCCGMPAPTPPGSWPLPVSSPR